MTADSHWHTTESGARGLRRRWGTTDWGSLPIVLGLSGIWLIFWLANEKFLSPLNLTNLVLQIAALGTLAISVFLVLLLGEIDLSAGMPGQGRWRIYGLGLPGSVNVPLRPEFESKVVESSALRSVQPAVR